MSCHISLSLFWSLVSPSLIKAFELIGMVEHNMYTEDGMPACCLSVRKANESLAWQQHKKGLLWEGGRLSTNDTSRDRRPWHAFTAAALDGGRYLSHEREFGRARAVVKGLFGPPSIDGSTLYVRGSPHLHTSLDRKKQCSLLPPSLPSWIDLCIGE